MSGVLESDMTAGGPIKLFVCDPNWTDWDQPFLHTAPSAPQDWALTDPRAFLDWHRSFGSNAIFMDAYTFCGYAFYPTRLGPVAPGPGRDLLPRLFELARDAGMPFWSYFCAGTDLIMSNLRNTWIIPGSRENAYHGFMGPESPWTDLLCERMHEFFSSFPVDWLLIDWFVYGSLKPDFPVQPAWFAQKPFAEIIGRALPAVAQDITPEESLAYKREVLARQFTRIRDTVRAASPKTRLCFNVPYWQPRESLWVGHPMLEESEMLFAESSDEVVEWLLSIRKPGQRVMTTIIGRQDGVCDPNTWRKWHERGCDLCGYAFGTPPDFRPHRRWAADVEIVRRAFQDIP